MQHSECDAVTVCTHYNDSSRGRCANESNRQWNVYIWKAEFPQRDAAGEHWDAFGGLPDPKIAIGVNGTSVGSYAVDDSYKFDQTGTSVTPIRITLKTGDALDVWASDVDVSSDDPADGIRFTNALGIARSYGYSGKLYNNRVFVEFSVMPVP